MPSPAINPAMLPNFNAIQPNQIEAELKKILDNNRQKIAAILAETVPFTWGNLMQPMEDLNDDLGKFWSPISHLHSVMETDQLREAYNASLPHLIKYGTEISQNEKLYSATLALSLSPEFQTLQAAQRKIIENDLRDFKLSGIHLPPDKKARLATLQQESGQATTKFSENVLDATQGFFIHLLDRDQLKGLTEQALQLAIDNARLRNLNGYVLTLDFPSYSTAMKFLENRDLRKTLYEAHTTRASDRGPHAGNWDNTEVMNTILKIRHEIAELVGFKNYAELSLATKMAKTPDEVLNFLHDLLRRSKPIAEEEYKEIEETAKQDNVSPLEVWDIAYYSDKLSQAKFNFSQEDLRPYFPVQTVLNGMFQLVNTIYGITIKKEEGIAVWHPDVQFFSITDDQNALRGGFYIDLYARQHKRDGAWMDECRTRRRLPDGKVQYPIAYLTCNFMPPVSNQSLLTHDDVLTLFHEFGHCLHHMLTKVDYPSVGGINGVPWDAVEFPSQFMENFCWEKSSLDLISRHYQTGEKLPDDLYKRMLDAKYFQTGMQMVRQLEFSIFDFRLHHEYDPKKTNQVQTILNEVRHETSVTHVPEFNRFQNSFSHIFAGSYGAGYYSYKWAEVLSADAYEQFSENGILNPETGHSFMQNILEVGGVRDPMDSFIAFRGRRPKIDALLEQSGITRS